MKNNILFSIVIPMYNAEAYISSCLDSIIQQGVNPNTYEIIIVNDGSKDSSCKIVEDYIAKVQYANITLLNQENKGQSAARNVGMSKAMGKYIQFIDADDYLVSSSLLQIVKFEQEEDFDKPFDMITFGICYGDTQHNQINDRNGECIFRGNGYDYIASHNYNNSPCYYWLNKDFINSHNLKFEEGKLCEDGMFTLTALLNANSIAHIDSNVYCYVLRPNSTTSTRDLKRRYKLIDGFCYAIEYFDKMICIHKGMNSSCRERIIERRDSYLFFLLVRMLKMGDYKLVCNTTKRLKDLRVYPIYNFPGRDYPSLKLKVITRIFNFNKLYLLICKLYSLKLRNEK